MMNWLPGTGSWLELDATHVSWIPEAWAKLQDGGRGDHWDTAAQDAREQARKEARGKRKEERGKRKEERGT